MSTEARRTLVVDLDRLNELRDQMVGAYEVYPYAQTIYKAQVNVIEMVIAAGTTVEMDAVKVAGLAKALAKVGEIREADWERAEREQFYSEAQAVDADWMPAGGPA